MKLTAQEKIFKAKIELRKNKQTNFFSYLVSQFQIIEDTTIQTACVSALKEIRYNPAFVDKLSSAMCVFLLAHEVLHYALRQLFRLPKANHMKANMAMDLKVNNILVEEGIGKVIEGGLIPTNHCYIFPNTNIKISNINLKTTEQIYEEIHDEEVDPGQSGQGGLDGHEFAPMTQEAVQQLNRDIAGAVMSQERGFKSGDLKRMFKDIHDPIVPWRDVLARFVQPFINDSYSWQRLNKKTIAQGILLPGYIKSEKIKGAFTVDTSGSMSEAMLTDVVSEIKGLLNSFKALEIKLLIGDSDLKESYDMDQTFDISVIKCVGGGGTSHKFMYKYMQEEQPSFMISFTDGYSDIEQMHNSYDVTTPILWLQPEGTRDLSNYGTVAWIKSN